MAASLLLPPHAGPVCLIGLDFSLNFPNTRTKKKQAKRNQVQIQLHTFTGYTDNKTRPNKNHTKVQGGLMGMGERKAKKGTGSPGSAERFPNQVQAGDGKVSCFFFLWRETERENE